MTEDKIDSKIKCKNFCPYDKRFCPFLVGGDVVSEDKNTFKKDVIPEEIKTKKNSLRPQPKKTSGSTFETSGDIEWMSFFGTITCGNYEISINGSMFDLTRGTFKGGFNHPNEENEEENEGDNDNNETDNTIEINGYISTNDKSCDLGGAIEISSKDASIVLTGNYKTNYVGGGGVIEDETENPESSYETTEQLNAKLYSGSITLNNDIGKITIQTNM